MRSFAYTPSGGRAFDPNRSVSGTGTTARRSRASSGSVEPTPVPKPPTPPKVVECSPHRSQVARGDEPLLDEHLVTDAVAHVVLLGAVRVGELPDDVVVVRGLDAVGRRVGGRS